MKNISLIGVFVLSLLQPLLAQMINGGFEQYDNTASDTYPYSINYALGWRNLNNTSDLGHPNTAGQAITPTPRTGVGHARFGVPINGLHEYFYGSTQPLTAGQTYVASFWVRKDYSTTLNIPVGLHIGTQVPAPQQLNPYVPTLIPQVRITPTSTQWVRGYFCFTPQSSVKHYVTIGAFSNNGTGEQQLFLVDDVEVTLLNPNATLPTASITIPKTIYCQNEAVIVDGSNSTGGTAYQWSLTEVVGGNETTVFTGAVTNGQPTTFSTASITGFNPGLNKCYRLYLEIFGDCKDKVSVDFCFQHPQVNFLHDGQPVCEGDIIDLSVTGDNGWTYTWSDANGQLASGAGLKTLQVAPQTGNATYTVTVTTPEGCTETKTYTFTVHSQNNLPPWMNGINGTNEYTYYVTAGQLASFTSTVFNDNANENIAYTIIDNIPSPIPHTIVPPALGASGGVLQFSMQTYLTTPPGIYDFVLIADDRNECQPGIDTFKFKIVVLCHFCPECIGYEDRSPSGTPLPMKTAAGKCITAGLTEQVSTGSDIVYFTAGQFITLGPNFEAGPGFEAVIDTLTCTVNCNDCCEYWTGFTYDELPDPFYMNFHDSDPTNDFIQVTDSYHPFCAFGAKGFEFEILTRWGNSIHTSAYHASFCCSFQSPAPENPIAHSPIWWDGYRTNLFGNLVRSDDGTYYYSLKLFGCDGQTIEKHGYVQIGGPPGMQQNNEQNDTGAISDFTLISEVEQHYLDSLIHQRQLLDETISVTPNPTTDIVRITGADDLEIEYQVFDDKGIMLSRKEKPTGREFSMESYVVGTYYVRVYANNTYIVRKLIKL